MGDGNKRGGDAFVAKGASGASPPVRIGKLKASEFFARRRRRAHPFCDEASQPRLGYCIVTAKRTAFVPGVAGRVSSPALGLHSNFQVGFFIGWLNGLIGKIRILQQGPWFI